MTLQHPPNTIPWMDGVNCVSKWRLSIEGPKGVGKTSTAERRAKSAFRLDDPSVLEVVAAQPDRMTTAARPTLIDEWQRYPASWDIVRRSVDDDASAFHVRDRDGRHEVDLVVVRDDQRVVGLEVKLSASVEDADVQHLL